MKERKINLEEIINTLPSVCIGYKNSIKDAMKEACRQTLELAAENADTEKEILHESGVLKSVGVVDKQSILNTINQIE